ncbi:transposase [Clostridiaceae bacterium BL-3]|nr:transposase [Clostridiaceae bacterium BL-3]
MANYERKNWTKESGLEYPSWYRQKKALKDHFWYKSLPSQTAQEVLKQLGDSWKSFYALKKTGVIENPKPPKFKHSNFNIRYLNKGFVLQDGTLRLSLPKKLRIYLKEKYSITDRYLFLKMPAGKEIAGAPKIVEIIPLPNNKKYSLNIIVEKQDVKLKENNDIYMGIDLGVNNLVTAYISTGKTFIISGRQLLSINRYFDKKISYYQSISDAQQSSKGIKHPKKSKRVRKLYEKRAKQVNHVLHTAAKKVVETAEKHNVCKIIVGDITNIRENKSFGKVNNQKFHKWFYKRLTDKITYKAEDRGISIEKQEESFSSQCSPNVKEVSKEYAERSNRKYRGLYKENNKIYNADCVGAYNILKKYLCRIEKSIPAVVGLDTPEMYRWSSIMGFIGNPKLSISMEM